MAIISSGSERSFSYIAFFDLDRTITAAISGRALAKGAYKKGLMKNLTLIKALINSAFYKLNLRDQAKIIDSMAGWTKGLGEKEYLELCNYVLIKKLLPSVFKEALVEISSHKNKGARIVLLSSAVDPVCNGIATELGLDDVICSHLEVIDNRLTGKPVGSICYGQVKSDRLIEYCRHFNSEPSSSWYYGDSISDLAALMAVGNPVCINPDSALRKKAIELNWDVRVWKDIRMCNG
jgi:putative phosphoserine phosphatase / 1-acylglycerol-3-phosphate O-acyltransferase